MGFRGSEVSGLPIGTNQLSWRVTGDPSPAAPPSAVESSPALSRAVVRAGSITLQVPLVVTVEPDDDAYIAKSSALPQLFGVGETAQEAVEALGLEIESLWKDLNEDSDFTDEWNKVREQLAKIIGDAK